MTLYGGEWTPVDNSVNTYERTYFASKDLSGYRLDGACTLKNGSGTVIDNPVIVGNTVKVTVMVPDLYTGTTEFSFNLRKPANVSGMKIWHSGEYQDIVIEPGNVELPRKAKASFDITTADMNHDLTVKKVVFQAQDSEAIPDPNQKFNIDVTFGNGSSPVSPASGSHGYP